MSPDRLAALIADYEQTREDERSFHATLATVYTVGVAILAGLATYVSNTANPVAEPILALAPLVPLALFAYCASIGLSATLRIYHARSIEDLLSQSTAGGDEPYEHWTTLISQVQSLRIRSSSAYGLLFRGGYLTMIVAAIVTFGGSSLYLGSLVSPAWQSLMIVFYTPMVLLILASLNVGTQRGKSLYSSALASARARRTGAGTAAVDDAGPVLSYFVVPRPADFVKSPFLVLGALMCATSSSPVSVPHQVGAVLVALVALEFLAYQAQYQWNDIRGASEDEKHSRRKSRRRLPVRELGLAHAIRVSTVTLLFRVFASLVIAYGDWFGLRSELVWFIGLIWLLAFVYEWFRSRKAAALTIAAVTLGYPLRVAAGVAVSGFSPADDPVVYACLLLSALAFGLAFVGLTWAQEGIDLLKNRSRFDGLAPHVAVFVREAGIASLSEGLGAAPHPLERAGKKAALWNLGIVASSAVIGVGILALRPTPPRVAGVLLAVSLTATAIAIGLAPSTRRRFGAVLVCLLVSAGPLVQAWSVPVLVLWSTSIAYLTVYVLFRASNYEEMTSTLSRAAQATKGLLGKGGAWLLGPSTAAALGSTRRGA